ncbi:FHA domain-containing protein [Singulisphaera acidiphila]|uniref:FHA domain-containing protein n=1 Tax=Singulisphaera acidiphila (strain ATCC BAA-1392 / DSM 18658 / VKM B-2454 / MOB10) TaxID=886293 RepID=L0DFA0_SINAD|nr:FHA domain-containing protein [Singulisphaera acidiphila]AGA27488.1 FHA domain-containing protein [Singulisphaera acidiphila DSM 18658]
MSSQLVPMNPGTFPTIPLQRPILLIGRHPECDVRLDLAKISRRHCCVALAYDRVMIRDLGSRNGLRVNGRLIDEAQLHPGDEVAIGPILYRVESLIPHPQSPAPIPPSPPAVTGAKASKPASLPSLPNPSTDLDSDLIPLDF